ncbi:MAG: DegQ family serine endoprotease [Deltaproteobacteria bacterium]|nr:DegQ family serine endoprotease [Deltaproteobacteria bacterium]
MKSIQKLSVFLVILFATVLFMGLVPQSGVAANDQPVSMIPANFTSLAEKVRYGVVNIRVVKTPRGADQTSNFFRGNPFEGQSPFERRNPFEDFFGPFQGNGNRPIPRQQGLGSGFVIDKSGYIVTNNHVVEGADEITVTLTNKKEFKAKLIGRDPKTDLALVKIDAAPDLVPLNLGDSDALSVGEWVVAIGSPFGLEQTVTAGIVSAKGRVIGSGPYDDFIQTDTSINPGNSGGPLINMTGEVIGINTAIIAQGQGIGFAIPINMARGIVNQLRDKGEVTRAWLGISIQDITEELKTYYGLKNQKGVLVTEVFKDSPAEDGGIRAEDIITSIQGRKVESSHELVKVVANLPVGEKVPIALIRRGADKTVSVTMAKRDDSDQQTKPASEHYEELGLKVSELSPEIAKRFGYNRNEKGVVILEVKKGSDAESVGIRAGDMVRSVNNTVIATVEEYRRLVDALEKGSPMALLIKRPNAGFIVVQLQK